MTFFASRRNGAVEQQGGSSSTGTVSSPGGEASGLPPWVESAVKKLLASVLPQFKPLVDKTELVLADAQTTLAALRAEQRETQAELASLRLAQIRLLVIAAALWPVSALAQAPTGAATNVPPGYVWTYLGPTFGADWVSPSVLVPPIALVPPVLITDSKNGPFPSDYFALQIKTQTSSDANYKYIWTCTIGICNGADPGNADTERVITIVQPGTAVDIIASQAIYFINKQGRPGPPYSSFPAYSGQNVIGICDADGAGCWAGNSIITDNRGQGTPTPKPMRFMVGWEADFQVNSTNSIVSGFMTGGSSTVQPGGATGYSCLWLDGQVRQGTVAQWGSCISSQSGAATVFATAAMRASSGANVNSQIYNMWWSDAGGVRRTTGFAATPGGILIGTDAPTGVAASIALPDGAAFATGNNGGLRINNLIAVQGLGLQLNLGADVGWGTVHVGNAANPTTIYGSTLTLNNIATVPGAGHFPLCINTVTNQVYKSAGATC